MACHAYMLKCADGTLYSGATSDLKRRLLEHNTGKRGAKYTRARRPVELAYTKRCMTLAKARAVEAEWKRMTREQKLALIESKPVL